MPAIASAPTMMTFPSRLGWIALLVRDDVVFGLTFGHATPKCAVQSMHRFGEAEILPSKSEGPLVERLRAYTEGAHDDFEEVAVELGDPTPFQRRVMDQCRKIPYGSTLTYGQLAAQAGVPRAARAVGNVMAANRIPLIIPCHRVVASTGGAGHYSAGEGTRTKLRLLEMEAAPSSSRAAKHHGQK